MGRLFSEEIEQRIGQEYTAGSPSPALAHKYGTNAAQIHRIIKRLGVPSRSSHEAAILRADNRGDAKPFFSPYLTSQQKEYIVEQFSSGKEAKDIANVLGGSTARIYSTLKQFGIDTRGSIAKYSQKDRQIIVTEYSQGSSLYDLGIKYNVTPATVLAYVREFGVKSRSLLEAARVKYPINETCFDEITEESSYWVGFLMADGCVTSDKGSYEIRLELGVQDIDHVLKFQKFTGTLNNGVYRYKRLTKSLNMSETATLIVTSQQIGEKLISYGVVPNKTYSAKCLNEELLNNRHFWRGMIDGDGCIRQYKSPRTNVKTLSKSIDLTGTKEICEQFLDFVRKIIPNKNTVRKLIRAKCSRICFYGNTAEAIIKHLYEDCTVSLDRKYSLAQDIIHSKEI